MTFSSENESVIKIDENSKQRYVYKSNSNEYQDWVSLCVNQVSYGAANLKVQLGNEVLTLTVIIPPDSPAVPEDPVQTGLTKQKLQWEAVPGVDGYIIKKYKYIEDYFNLDYNDCEVVANVSGGATNSAIIDSKWGEKGYYLIEPYVLYNGKTYSNHTSDNIYCVACFNTLPMSIPINSVTKASSTSFSIEWDAWDEVTSYELYRSTLENHKYKLIGTYTNSNAKNGKITVTNKVKAGTRYFYKLVPVVGDQRSEKYSTKAAFIPKNYKTTKKYTAKPLDTASGFYQYTEGSNYKIVCYINEYDNKQKLKIYTFDSKKKLKSTKTINLTKLLKFDVLGGVYHAPDGNNYMAVGCYNYKESRTKTVIKVVKFDKNWKKIKTASIKANASNSFDGIVAPFRAGTVAFDMLGSKLYMFTARTMFVHSDGLNHQSNIAFEIDTKTMKAKERNISYCSHSFNQFVKFKDGSLYLADHGDAYPRGIKISIADDYGLPSESSLYDVPFIFLGEIGDNATGATLRGFEVSENNVIVVGNAEPHGSKIKGKSGFKGYSRNLFMTITNRKTADSKLVWLTKFDPEGKKSVRGVWFKKLTDNRFAIIYGVENTKTYKNSLYYMAIDENGKILYKTSLKGIEEPITNEVILKDGRLWWFSSQPNSQDYVYKNGKWVTKKIKGKTTFYGIPARWQ